ncbi:hypothetical protein XENOCAPTIV_028253 [Xenoophorus captivus]|uniref:Uncharacterized protein n=1 Tax=Xenoophorus captivus TaxID=1517983 RepID=A0ABV0RX72_9TELE
MLLLTHAAEKKDTLKEMSLINKQFSVNQSIQNTHQLLQNGATELIIQSPDLCPGGQLCQDPPCKVTDSHLQLGVLQETEDVLQQVLIHQVTLELLHLCYIVLNRTKHMYTLLLQNQLQANQNSTYSQDKKKKHINCRGLHIFDKTMVLIIY